MKTMQQRLMAMKKADMIEAAIRLGIPPIKQTAKKAQWAEHIAGSMEQYGENLLLCLRLEEVRAINRRLAGGGKLCLNRENEDHAVMVDALETLEDLALVDWDDGYIPDERLAGWLAMNERTEETLAVQDALYDYMQGCLMHVGMMPLNQLTARGAAQLEGLPEDGRREMQELCRMLMTARDGFETLYLADEGEPWAVYSELDDPEALRQRLQQPFIAELEYADFTMEQMLYSARVSNMPGDVALYEPMIRALEKRGVEDAEALLGDAVMLVQNEALDEAQEMLLDEIRPRNINEAHKYLQMFTDLCNTLPRWWNKGHSPEEIFFKPRRATAMPGRNDPCPCGSGRKYKQCCGKRMN